MLETLKNTSKKPVGRPTIPAELKKIHFKRNLSFGDYSEARLSILENVVDNFSQAVVLAISYLDKGSEWASGTKSQSTRMLINKCIYLSEEDVALYDDVIGRIRNSQKGVERKDKLKIGDILLQTMLNLHKSKKLLPSKE